MKYKIIVFKESSSRLILTKNTSSMPNVRFCQTIFRQSFNHINAQIFAKKSNKLFETYKLTRIHRNIKSKFNYSHTHMIVEQILIETKLYEIRHSNANHYIYSFVISLPLYIILADDTYLKRQDVM